MADILNKDIKHVLKMPYVAQADFLQDHVISVISHLLILPNENEEELFHLY